MDKNEFLILIEKYLDGKASLEDEQMLLNFYSSFQNTTDGDKKGLGVKDWDEGEFGIKQQLEDKMLMRLQQSILQQKNLNQSTLQQNTLQQKISRQNTKPVKAQSKKVALWPQIAAVVAVFLIVGSGVWFFSNPDQPDKEQGHENAHNTTDIAPGKNVAVITLANGKTINLSDTKTGVVIDANKLTYSDGSAVSNLSPSGRDGVAREGSNNNNPLSQEVGSLTGGERSRVQTLVMSTPRGGTYQLILPDGTKVWLNAASSIKFPAVFSGLANRSIELNGEAYFEVFKDKAHPFIVRSNGQEVKVLGTHFNINAYNNEGSVKTTLLEGAVQVKTLWGNGKSKTINLKHDQQATLTTEQLAVNTVNTAEVVAWKNGYFDFNDENLQSVMRKLARWYNVEIFYEGNPSMQGFTGKLSRSNNINEVLKALESTGTVHFKVQERRVTVIDK